MKLGPYEVLAPIGAGGMGEVYRARDERLARDVAIKVLPRELAANPESFRRFEQEARTSGTLNHPNVLATYDVGTHDGVSFLVSELLVGESLRERLNRGPVPLRTALDIGAQIARGLGAVHDKGIIHRDLKPENVFLTSDGQVKLLDFGLAKATRPESAIQGPGGKTLTRSDCIVGTAGYMAPEQVLGDELDSRADLFALGVCLYEMLSGQRAFAKPSAVETMSAILVEEPRNIAAAVPDVPPEVAGIVHRCLDKRKESRFQSARDLAFALESVSPTASVRTVPQFRWSSLPVARWPLARSAAVASACLVCLILGVLFGRGATPRTVPAPVSLTQLTYSGADAEPAASPDGRMLAFSSTRDRSSRIFVSLVKTGAEVAVTAGPRDSGPRFFPDGESVLFTRHEENGKSSLYRVPVLGGEPRRLVGDATSGDVSSDGSMIAFLRVVDEKKPVRAAFVAPVNGGPERELARFESWIHAPRFSPDGREIAIAESGSEQSGIIGSITLVGMNGQLRRLPAPIPRRALSAVCWLGSGQDLLLCVRDTGIAHARNSGGLLYRQDARSAEVHPLTWWPNAGSILDVLGEGRVVYESLSTRGNLREARLSNESSHRWFTRGTGTDRQPVYSPDGNWILFSSDRSGNLDLWMASRQSGAVRRITDDTSDDWDPAFSPDGQRILWSSNRTGHFEVWTSGLDGTGQRQLSSDGVDAENPVLSPDGRTLFYGSLAPGREGIWRANPDGTQASLLAPGAANMLPEVSPDGRFLLYRSGLGAGRRFVKVLRLDDGVAVFEIGLDIQDASAGAEAGRARWLPDGRAIAFVGLDERGTAGVFVQDFAPGKDTAKSRRPLVRFDPGLPAESFGVSPDGQAVMLAVRESQSSIVLAEPVPKVSSRLRR
ncbi:MAG: serine/threonine-protein kinase [Thermoanaerobaculia bacterium]|nr:serine/threonine-protein kinase [Thermoanaerobaculia bacterium]